jgi:hypothetical protein
VIIDSDEKLNHVAVTHLADTLIKTIDKLTINKRLSFTQKQVIENMREQGVFNAIMLGQFKNVSVSHLLTLFSVFDCCFVITPIHKKDYEKLHTDPTTKH